MRTSTLPVCVEHAPVRRDGVPHGPHKWGYGCNALSVTAGEGVRIERFDPAMQDAFRTLVLDGMAERWGAIDESLNTDLDDIDTHYGDDCVLVAVDGATVIGTGILLLRATEGEIVRMSIHRNCRRRGIARQVLAELVNIAAGYGVKRIVVETNTKWIEARNLYEAFGFRFTRSAPGPFGREAFYELLI
jgi:ribosomal protein S18 acetylase RimI-like enzyme